MSSQRRRRKVRVGGPMAPLPPILLVVLLVLVVFAIWYLSRLK